jgi:hypothetical protein
VVVVYDAKMHKEFNFILILFSFSGRNFGDQRQSIDTGQNERREPVRTQDEQTWQTLTIRNSATEDINSQASVQRENDVRVDSVEPVPSVSTINDSYSNMQGTSTDTYQSQQASGFLLRLPTGPTNSSSWNAEKLASRPSMMYPKIPEPSQQPSSGRPLWAPTATNPFGINPQLPGDQNERVVMIEMPVQDSQRLSSLPKERAVPESGRRKHWYPYNPRGYRKHNKLGSRDETNRTAKAERREAIRSFQTLEESVIPSMTGPSPTDEHAEPPSYVAGKNCPAQVSHSPVGSSTDLPQIGGNEVKLNSLIKKFSQLVASSDQVGGGGDSTSDSTTLSASSTSDSSSFNDSESSDNSEESASLLKLKAQLKKELKEKKMQYNYIKREIQRKKNRPGAKADFLKGEQKGKLKKLHVTKKSGLIKPMQEIDDAMVDDSEIEVAHVDHMEHELDTDQGLLDDSGEVDLARAEKDVSSNSSMSLEQEKESPYDKSKSKESMSDTEQEVPVLRLGQVYQSFKSFDKALSSYCASTFSITKIRRSEKNTDSSVDQTAFPYNRVTITCIHSGSISPKPVDKSRPNQSYQASHCGFLVYLSFVKRRKAYIVKKFIRDHCGHRPSKSEYQQHVRKHKLSQPEIDLFIKNYAMNLNTATHKVSEEIKKQTGKQVSHHRIRRYKQTVSSEKETKSDMKELLSLLKEESKKDKGFTYKVVYCDSSTQPSAPAGKRIVKVIFAQTSRMKRLFRKHGNVLLIDGTYNLTNRGYVTVPFHIIDHRMRTRICAFALISNESREVLEAALQQFKEANEAHLQNLQHIIIDKDFTEAAAISSLFDSASVIICSWHASRSVDKKISETHLPSDEQHLKPLLKKLFRELMHAPTEEKFFEKWDEFLNLAIKHPSLNSLIEYLQSNWIQYRTLWAFYHLKHNQVYFSLTNNRAENYHKQLKALIRRQSKIPVVVKEILKMSERQANVAMRKNIQSKHKSFMPGNISNPISKNIMKQGQGWLSTEALKLLRKQGDAASKLQGPGLHLERDSVACTRVSGTCSFWSNFKLPCQHMLATRWRLDENLLTESIIDARWILSSSEGEPTHSSGNSDKGSEEDEQSSFMVRKNETARTTSFNDFHAFIKEMASNISQFPGKKKEKMKKSLAELMNAWNNGLQAQIVTLTGSGKESDESDESDIFSPKKKNKKYSTSSMTAKEKNIKKTGQEETVSR